MFKLLKTTGLMALACAPFIPTIQAKNTERPNIIVIMTDDAGYSDLGCFGGEIDTPNLNKLAADGLRFKQFYNNARCSPTRASLLTGHYSQTAGVGILAGPGYETPFDSYKGYLNPELPTVANILGEAGFHTAMSGKWHLGGERNNAIGRTRRPLAHGFDNFFGILGPHSGYFLDSEEVDEHFFEGNQALKLSDLSSNKYLFNRNDQFYATDAITKRAIDFIDLTPEDKPFFLYLPYSSPHNPREAPESVIAKYRDRYSTPDKWFEIAEARVQRQKEMGLIPETWTTADFEFPRSYYDQMPQDRISALREISAIKAAEIEIVDTNVGRLVDHLKSTGEFDNTLIFFLSDNGAAIAHDLNYVWSTPFRGQKGDLLNGGMTTHCIVHWPEGLKNTGSFIEMAGAIWDITPTVLDIASVDYPKEWKGNPVPPLPGQSLLRTFQGDSDKQFPRILHWDLYGYKASILSGRWKWIAEVDSNGNTTEGKLIDLKNDPGELNDVSNSHKELKKEIRKSHSEWAALQKVVPYEVLKSFKGNKQPNFRFGKFPEATKP